MGRYDSSKIKTDRVEISKFASSLGGAITVKAQQFNDFVKRAGDDIDDVESSAGGALSIVSVTTSPYTVTVTDDILLVNTSDGAITINLLPATSSTKRLTIKDAGRTCSSVAAITIHPSGTNKLESPDLATIANANTTLDSIDGAVIDLISNGVDSYHVISSIV